MPEDIKDRGVIQKSEQLVGKRLGLGICGGIGAVEVIKIIRELRRYGAGVTPFLTPTGERFITALSVEWAAERAVVRDWEARAPHLEDYDAFLVAPATLNTIVKSATGIADNVVTLMVAAQIGAKRPVIYESLSCRGVAKATSV